jgi:hypothetical protein
MKVSSKELEAKKVKVVVDKNPVPLPLKSGHNLGIFLVH